MIVYADRAVTRPTRPAIEALHAACDHTARHDAFDHDAVLSCLIDAGELEAGIADAWCPDCDRLDSRLATLREAVVAAARALLGSWRGEAATAARWLTSAVALLREAALTDLPPSVRVPRSEGFAYYALRPESYMASAGTLARELPACPVACLGLRSIGTSLSAAVCASLLDRGWPVSSWTIRPRGHPFERQIATDASLDRWIAERVGHLWLLVDEGPGISGSSLASAAAALETRGIPATRIILLPAWVPVVDRLQSAHARTQWRRHRVLVTSFEQTTASGPRRLGGAPPGAEDWSAGAWRPALVGDAEWPAVQPQHERRKYRLRDPERIARFVGLGRYGHGRLASAQWLASEGLGPEPIDLRDGFLVLPFTEGRPLKVPVLSADSAEQLASYVASRLRLPDGHAGQHPDDLQPMLRTNAREALGDRWAIAVDRLLDECPLRCERCAAIDGRLLPHEWVDTGIGWVKTDALDHHDDHFLPGCQDIAWDVAGLLVEWELAGSDAADIVARYARLSADRSIAGRLPPWIAAYAAFRLGYVRLAEAALAGQPDQARFGALALRYERALQAALARYL